MEAVVDLCVACCKSRWEATHQMIMRDVTGKCDDNYKVQSMRKNSIGWRTLSKHEKLDWIACVINEDVTNVVGLYGDVIANLVLLQL